MSPADAKFLQDLQERHAHDLDKVVLTKTAFNKLLALALQNAK